MTSFTCPICDGILYETPDSVKVNKKPAFSFRNPLPTFNKFGRAIHPFEFDLNTSRPDRPRRVLRGPLLPTSTILTQCGHFFHKACIEKYMRAYRVVSRLSVTECPICFQVLYLPTRHAVDFESSEDFCENLEVKCRIFNAVYGELKDQIKDIETKLENVEGKILEAENQHKSLNPSGETVPTDVEEPQDLESTTNLRSDGSSVKKAIKKRRKTKNPVDIFAGPRLRAMFTDTQGRFSGLHNPFAVKR